MFEYRKMINRIPLIFNNRRFHINDICLNVYKEYNNIVNVYDLL